MFNFKTKNKIKMIGASVLCLSVMISGCNLMNQYQDNDNDERNVSNTEYSSSNDTIMSSATFESSVDTTSSSETIESIEPTETIETTELHDLQFTSQEANDYMNYYFDKVGIDKNADADNLTCLLLPFLFDEEAINDFINYYNDLKGTNYTDIKKYEIINLVSSDVYTSKPRSELYKKDVFDGLFECTIFNQGGTFTYADSFSDSLLNSYLANNNLTPNYIFSYEEIHEYLPELEKSNSYMYMYELFEKYSSPMQMPLNEYIGACMLDHNARLNNIGMYVYLDPETFEGEFGEKAKPYYINAYNEDLSNATGSVEYVDPFAPMTPEIFEKVYGYEPYDVSLDAIQGYTSGEYIESHQKSR